MYQQLQHWLTERAVAALLACVRLLLDEVPPPPLPPPDSVWRKVEQRLALDRCAQADHLLAYVLGRAPTPNSRIIDRRFPQ